jgi:hypothetical protein
VIDARTLLTGIVLGAVISLVVHELFQFGLAVGQWGFQGPRVGQALVTGGLIGAVSQMFGQSRGRR